MPSVLLDLPCPPEAHGGLWYSTSASTRFGRHHHHELELNVVVTGEAHYWFPHRELRVVAPAVLWIPPYVEHELLDTSDDLSMWVHSFRARTSDDWIEAASGRTAMPGQPEPPMWGASSQLCDGPRANAIDTAALAHVCARSRDGLLRPGVPELNVILSDVLALAVASASQAPQNRGQRTYAHPAAHRIARLLREPDAAEPAEALARSATLSRERLSRVFTQSFGIGLVQYKNHHQIQRFIHRYGQGVGANMLHSALDVGFGSYVQFHRAFKQVVGYSPAEHLVRVQRGIVDPARTGAR
jgi:AraC-like DNA-binding protein